MHPVAQQIAEGLGPMFATIELQKHAVADRYYHQLHPKPWAKSPEEGPGQECFLPPRGGFNLRCTQSPSKGLRPPLEGRALHSQECFLPPRGGFNLRCTQFTTQR